jgi:hypothetical protein
MANETAAPVYFANLPDADIGPKLVEKVENYERFIHRSGLWEIWRLSYKLWHSQDEEGFTAHAIG